MSAPRTIGWKLDIADRETLLGRFAPAYGEVVANHVTLQHKAPAEVSLPPPTSAEVVGVADDERGVQALVVAIGGTTDRPDGGAYHITWSLGPGRGAKESNDVIAQNGWRAIEAGIPISLTPASFG